MVRATSDGQAPEAALPPGLAHHPAFLNDAAQSALVEELRVVLREAPLVRPVTAWGKPMSVRMTSMGRVGWVIDRGRYRYVATHPETKRPWPAIPDAVLTAWEALSGWDAPPDCCLMNWYGEGAKMGLHRDADEGEAAFAAPVLSLSLGDPARFRIGGTERGGPTQSLVLRSGDALVMGGPSRLAYHGIDRVWFGGGDLLPDGGRINLTLRVVHSV
ncbi:MAG: alpha-ketoglutarate-dependent dioxygenase AlkB [Pseudomonadota bacterium]